MTDAKGDQLSQDDLFQTGKKYHDKKLYRDCSLWMDSALKVEGDLNADLVADYAAFCFTQDRMSANQNLDFKPSIRTP